jgi:hypothetical protein
MLRDELPRTHMYGSLTKVPFLKLQKCAALALIVKPDYITRHIDVKANLRQISPKLDLREGVAQDPHITNRESGRRDLSKTKRKKSINVRGPQGTEHENGQGHGGRSRFTIGQRFF